MGLMGMQGVQASMDDIVQTCRSNDSFHKAAAKNDLAYLNVCLSAGFPVNTQEGNGWTALHSAAKAGSTGAIQLLLKHNADPSIRDVNGRTAYDQAELMNHYDAMALLKNK
jgi:hypothetical protein